MILPFVRELLADAEATSGFQRAATHLKGGAGRIRVSGLTPTARALHYALLHRASARPLLLVVSDNRTAEELLPLLQSLCEMTGAATPDSVAYLPARDVLPFENLSPHPEIQEMRARALWRIASGTASLVVAPFAATAIRLRDAEYLPQPGSHGAPGGLAGSGKAGAAPEHCGLPADGRGGAAGRVCAARRDSGRVFAGDGKTGAH